MRRGKRLGTASKVAAVLVAWVWAPAAAVADDHPVTFPAGAFPNYSYAPPDTEAAVGDTVTFSGVFASHPLVWNTGDFPTQSAGTTNTYTFTRPGTFAFHCQIHASMVGSVHIAGNAFASPDFSWAPASPKTGQAVTFTPGTFTDPDGTVVRYEWDLNGDGVFEATGAAPSRTYSSAGSYNVGLRYVDDSHETSPAATHVVTVAQGTTAGGGGGGGTGGGGAGGGGTPSPSPTTPKPGSPSPGAGGSGGGSATSPDGGDQGAGTSTPGTTALRVRLGARALTFRSGRARVTVVLNLSGSAKATLRVGKTILATGSATLRAGTRSVRLTLTKAGARALRRAHGGVRATLTVTARRSTGAKATTARRTLTVKLA